MAFENALLTKEEQVEWKEKDLQYDDVHFGDYKMTGLYSWTIDRECGMWLMLLKQFREPPFEESFMFYWNGHVINFIGLPEGIGERNLIWKKVELFIPKEIKYKAEEVLADLRDAFATYRWSGNDYLNGIAKGNYSVKFDF